MGKRRSKASLAGLAVVAIGVLAFASPASAVSVSNACTNSVTANASQIDTNTVGSVPSGEVTGGNTIMLTGIQQQVGVPGAVFIAGYNLGLLHQGVNDIPVNVSTVIEGTNTDEAEQTAGPVGGSPPNGSVTISTTITDPNGTPGDGDETATPATGTVSYPMDMTWTAASTGHIELRQQSTASNPSPTVHTLLINALVGGTFNVQFRCAPGTVLPPEPPGTISLIDPAPFFASTAELPPVADAGVDQTVSPGAPAQLDGTGSDDPNGDPLTYAWTQTAGPSVTLSDAASPMPTFTAPSSPATLAFDLEVCEDVAVPQCDTDSVTVTVAPPPTALPPLPPPAATNPKCKKLKKQLKKAKKAKNKKKVKKIKKKMRKLGC